MSATVVVRRVGTAWMAKAGCRGAGHLFFGLRGETVDAREVREAKARAICRTCPVMSPCRAWAREHHEYGLWGGESEQERAAAGFPPRWRRSPADPVLPVGARPRGEAGGAVGSGHTSRRTARAG